MAPEKLQRILQIDDDEDILAVVSTDNEIGDIFTEEGLLRCNGACVGIKEPRMTFKKLLVPFFRIIAMN